MHAYASSRVCAGVLASRAYPKFDIGAFDAFARAPTIYGEHGARVGIKLDGNRQAVGMPNE